MDFLVLALSALTAVMAAHIGTIESSDGAENAPLAMILPAAAMGSLLGAIAQYYGHGGYEVIIFSALGAFLLTGAVLDSQTGWAPDSIMLPVTVLGVLAGQALGPSSGNFALAALLAVLSYYVVITAWIEMARRESRMVHMPPADFIAITLPIPIFGFDYLLAMFYIFTSVGIAACMVFPRLGNLLRKGEVISQVTAEHAAVSDQSVTFLAFAFPLIFLAVVIAIAGNF